MTAPGLSRLYPWRYIPVVFHYSLEIHRMAQQQPTRDHTPSAEQSPAAPLSGTAPVKMTCGQGYSPGQGDGIERSGRGELAGDAPNSAAPGAALGVGFDSYRRVLRSDTLPSTDHFIAFWGELHAARLDWFAFDHTQRAHQSPLSVRYLKPLFDALANYRVQEGDAARGASLTRLERQRGSIGGKWLYVRDELMKVTVALIEQLDARAVTEAKVNGIASRSDTNRTSAGDDQFRDLQERVTEPLNDADAIVEKVTESAKPPLPKSTEGGEKCRLAPSGAVWLIEGFGESGHLRNQIGVTNLVQLLRKPGQTVPWAELISTLIEDDPHSNQPMHNAEGVRDIQKERARLQGEIDEADNDAEMAESARLLDELNDHAMKAIGLGGNQRDLNSPIKRFRSRVYGRLDDVYKSMRAAKPPLTKLAAHFEHNITSCVDGYFYTPTYPSPNWEFEIPGK
jgi:hypothetical protein